MPVPSAASLTGPHQDETHFSSGEERDFSLTTPVARPCRAPQRRMSLRDSLGVKDAMPLCVAANLAVTRLPG